MSISPDQCDMRMSAGSIRRGWIDTGEAQLRFVDVGSGPPVVLLHGGLGDYRSWLPHLPLLASRHRVVAFSRRYSHASRCIADPDRHSLSIDVADAAALLERLGARPAHLVGTSYGALVALKLALEAPESVLKLVLAEPPLHEWLAHSASTRAAYDEFTTNV